jgi:peroxiredoxin Q/BCP
MAELIAGAKAPDFSLPTADGGTVRLKDFKGKTVVIYFYPKDDTPGCTKEACAFRDNFAALKKKGVVVIGVSADSVASHAKFAGKYDLPFILASDESKEMSKAYGVWQKKSMYGKTYFGIVRTTVVVDASGKVAKVYPKVKVEGHVDAIMADIGQL